MDKNQLFREKNLKKATGAEQLAGGIKVTGFGAWLTVIAGLLLILSLLLWGFVGNIKDVAVGAGQCKDGVLTCYFCDEDIDSIEAGMKATVDNKELPIGSIDGRLYSPNDLPNDVLYFMEKSAWYRTAKINCDLPDGTYRVTVNVGVIRPLDFISGGE